MAKKKESKFRGKVGANAQKQKSAASVYGHLKLPRGVGVFKEKAGGRASIDIMPYVVKDAKHPDRDEDHGVAMPGELWYKRPYKLHRNIGSGNDSAVCPTSIGKKCPICEFRTRRMKEGAEESETKALKASNRNVYCVIPIGMKEYEEKPYLWDISQFLFQDMLNDEIAEDADYEAFPDLEEGLTLKLRFSEEVFAKTKYAKIARIDFEQRKEVYDEEILNDVPCLDDVIAILTYRELEIMFFELGDEDESPGSESADEEEDDAPPKRKRKKNVEEEVEDAAEEEVEDEPEPPKRKKKSAPAEEAAPPVRRKKKPEPEPVEEEEVEEEVEETPPPAKKTKKTGGGRCPSGHTFGADCEKYDECDECDKWDDCIEEKEKG